MDEIKDSQTSIFSRFLDEPVHTNPFGRNKSGDRLYRRTERLIAAVFLMTNHIPSHESLRDEVRGVATSMLAKALSCKDELRSTNSQATLEFQMSIRHLISLVRLMVFGGFFSNQNAEVVSSAADELGTFISTAARSSLSESIVFSKDELLDVPDPYKGQRTIKDRLRIKDMPIVKDSSATSFKTTQVVGHHAAASANVRRSGILDILRSGGALNIRDIAANLPEYSEKTIQRELVSLVQQGLVMKSGERRWSRYSLAG